MSNSIFASYILRIFYPLLRCHFAIIRVIIRIIELLNKWQRNFYQLLAFFINQNTFNGHFRSGFGKNFIYIHLQSTVYNVLFLFDKSLQLFC